jgi:hypothetical protein
MERNRRRAPIDTPGGYVFAHLDEMFPAAKSALSGPEFSVIGSKAKQLRAGVMSLVQK